MPSEIKKQFGEKIRAARLRRGYSQEEFGARVGLHPTYVSGVENGKRNPSIDAIEAMAVCLDVTIPWLFSTRKRLGHKKK
ncbi:MAG: helix-turn-helix transcriptional regulator [Pseudomonadota bacterium]